MKSIKWLASLLLLLVAPSLFAQFTPKETPFFFPKGIYQTTDPIDQRIEYEKIFQGTWACNQEGAIKELIPGAKSITVVTDLDSTSSVTNPHAKMSVVLDHYYKMPDGQIRYTSLCGQELISQAQVDSLVKNLTSLVKTASENDNATWAKVLDLSVTARALKLGIKRDELVKQLDEKVPGYNITFRELHRLPKSSKSSDFVPRELHLGFNPPLAGILGVTWLNTGVIYYNPNAWMVDYVLTKPVIMQHEMVHVNSNVEKFPMSELFDAELMADMPIVLYPENTVNFQNHGYAADLREYAEIYFGFDWDQYNADVITFNYEGNIVYNDKNYTYYYNQLTQIKAELLKFFETVTIPEFYSDPVWWSAVNDIRGDNNSVFRMSLALHYNPTILGGAAKSADWVNSHSEEIKEIAKDAFEAGLEGSAGGNATGDMAMVTPQMRDQYESLFTQSERNKIETYFRQHPEKLKELKHMSPAEAIQFLSTFKSTSLKGATSN